MGKRGAPLGNKNAATSALKNPFKAALHRAIVQNDYKRLRAIIDKTLGEAEAGEAWATNLIAERLDGKVPQQITGAGEQGEHIITWQK